ncbi:hypothetical protein JCM30566_04730 [Marinitoga arctica]
MKKLLIILGFIGLFLGFAIIFFLLTYKYIMSVILFLIYFILSFILVYINERRFLYSLQKNLFSLIFFPFFPIIVLFHFSEIKPLYKPFLIQEEKLVNTSSISFNSVDLAPFILIIKYGDAAQRKYVVRLLFNSIKEEKIDFIEGLKLIRTAVSIDSHPDVVLYATDALTNLEKFLIEKISYYIENLNEPRDYINYAKYVYYYANSGFLAGEHKKEILWQSAVRLRIAVYFYSENSEILIYNLKILELLEEHEILSNMLDHFLDILKLQSLYEYAIFYYIKTKKTVKVRKLVNEYIMLGFKSNNEALKFILGD